MKQKQKGSAPQPPADVFQQIEKEKTEAAAEEDAFTLAPEKLMTILAKVGVQATAEQVTDFARQIEETSAKRRKCG